MASDPFFVDPTRRKRRRNGTSRKPSKRHEQVRETESNSLEDSDEVGADMFEESDSEEEHENDEQTERRQEEEEKAAESAADKRRRLAKEYLAELGRSQGAPAGEGENSAGENFDAGDLDREIIGSRLQKDAAEQKGWVYKHYDLDDKSLNISVRRVGCEGLTSIAVHFPYAYTASKSAEVSKWDISVLGKKPRLVKTVRGGPQYQEIARDPAENGHCDEIFACAVSPDGKYVVTGGRDRRVVVWSAEKLACVRVIDTKNPRAAVYGLAFRRGTDELYAACGDLKVRIYSIEQQAELETLYGHQDVVEDVSALALERCVTVGGRDRTAMLWKVADETRLTFRGGDSIEKYLRMKEKSIDLSGFYVEGSIDCVSMVDDGHFVTGSDNGNVCLWSLAKKKPVFTIRQAHGFQPEEPAAKASAEKSPAEAARQVPKKLPYWITSIHAVPYSDIFVSGSWDGSLRVWKLGEDMRSFEQVMELPRAKGFVNRIDAYEDTDNSCLRVYAALSKEHRLGRWQKKPAGARNAIYTVSVSFKKDGSQ